jgi:hypothetical protein
VRALSIIVCGKASSSEARGYKGDTKAIRRRLMGQEKDHRRFEKGHEVHEEQTRSVREEASEEDRRQWEKTRDLGKEASETPEGKHERPRQSDKDQER